jgi:RimJ/RimL family protein N-acetyltransferase
LTSYKILNKQIFAKDIYSIVPIRYQDRLDIMNWRNEQIYHLRQNKPLTIDDQEQYFKNIVQPLFSEEKPSQILFSYLENQKCVGYGGLVHINWIDKNAEISFIIETALEADYFQLHWVTYLGLIEQLAFEQLDLHKVFVYAFDLRPHLYIVLDAAEYKKEAVLTEHCFFQGSFIDVVIYSKIKK